MSFGMLWCIHGLCSQQTKGRALVGAQPAVCRNTHRLYLSGGAERFT